MDARAKRRAGLVPALARMVRNRDFRNAYGALLGGSREHTYIPVLPDDRMGYLWDRLGEAGQSAIVVVEGPQEGAIGQLLVIIPASQERIAAAREDDRVADIHDDAKVEMFLELVQTMKDVVLRRVSVRLIDRDGLQPAH